MTMPAVMRCLLFASLPVVSAVAMAQTDAKKKPEDASAASQYQALKLTRDPSAAAAGSYKLDSHHTSVIAKLAHMDLSRYTIRFNDVGGHFDFDPSLASGSHLEIAINPTSVDTGDPVFDKKIATKYFEADRYPTIAFTSVAAKIVGEHASVSGILDFHGVKKPVVLNMTYRGFAQGRMGFSGEATFKRSDFGVGEWVPLEADDVTILVETEFVKQ